MDSQPSGYSSILVLKDMGSSPVAFMHFLYFFFDLLVSKSLFLILCATGYIYFNLECVYVTISTVNNFNKPTCELFAR